jgi:hypothetical protein
MLALTVGYALATEVAKGWFFRSAEPAAQAWTGADGAARIVRRN